MHDVAVEFDEMAVGDRDRSPGGNAPDIVAAQIEQHEMFGQFLGIGEQAGLVGLILRRIGTARAGAGDRANGHLAIARAHQDFGRGTDQCEIGQVEIIEEGGGVHPAQRAIEVERRQRERRGKALRQHHLKDITGCDIILCRVHHHAIIAPARAAVRRRARGWRRSGRRRAIAERTACVRLRPAR